MSTLIVYSTKYGTTEKCAKKLAEKITGKMELFKLNANATPDLSPYDTIILGGSMYIGQIQKEMKDFYTKNLNILRGKTIGLFACGMRENEEAKIQLELAYPKELSDIAITQECFGGEFLLEKMNFFEKFIVKNVSKIKQSQSKIINENIDSFAYKINHHE